MKSLKDTGSFIEWISQMADAVANHGLWKIVKGTIALAFALIALNVALNPEIIFDKFNQYTEQIEQQKIEQEKSNIEYRRNIDPVIRGELKELVNITDASRACVMEFHNGTSNLSSLGFLYAAMTYEETRSGLNKVSQIYNEVSLSLFNISEIMYNDGYWYGTTDSLSKIDPALAQGISSSGTKWVAALLLESTNEVGFLILSFDYIPENQQVIGKNIRRYGASIASKLDYISRL